MSEDDTPKAEEWRPVPSLPAYEAITETTLRTL